MAKLGAKSNGGYSERAARRDKPAEKPAYDIDRRYANAATSRHLARRSVLRAFIYNREGNRFQRESLVKTVERCASRAHRTRAIIIPDATNGGSAANAI